MRHRNSGTFAVALPASEAIGLFTPEGERAWVPGWDPLYATEEVSESVGTTFTTHGQDVDTYWVIIEIDRAAGRSAFARTTPGQHAGTVTVQCVDTNETSCEVTVSYDMTLLDGGEPAQMDVYGKGYNEMMEEWSRLVAGYLGAA